MASRKKKVEDHPLDDDVQKMLGGITKEYGEGSIMRLGSRGHIETPHIPTGSICLDIDLGIGGFPRGRIVEIYGPESSGKTTLSLSVIAHAQKIGGLCAIVDVEHALDARWAETIGVDVDELLISQPDCGEDALGITQKLVESNKIAVVVVDSVAALVPRAEIEGQMGDSHLGLQARLMSQAMRKLNGIVSKSNTCLIFTNQIREKIGVMFGSPETTSGGNALKFYASIRIRISKSDKIAEAGKDPIGNIVRYKILKNKMAPPFRDGTFDILFDSGISYEYSLIDAGLEFGVLEKRGSWIAWGSEQLGQGKVQCAQALKDDKERAAKLDGEIRIKSDLVKIDAESKSDVVPPPDPAEGGESADVSQ